jgi:hypothetical protein
VRCPLCQHENTERAKFCEECATPLTRKCANCDAQLSATAKFCPECAHPVQVETTPPTRFATPSAYTPLHLAERILTSRSAVEGERKQVTVLFADIKGSMDLLAGRDPEEARRLLDPVLELMMEAVHHYDGTVNQVMGDGIMALWSANRPRRSRRPRLLRRAAHAGPCAALRATGPPDRGSSGPDPCRSQFRGCRGAFRR